MRLFHSSSTFILGSVFLAVGCAHKQPAPPVTPVTSELVQPTPQTAATPTASAAVTTCNTDDQCADDQICVDSRCRGITQDVVAQCMAPAHFDYNQDQIRAEDRTNLQRTARCMKALPSLQVTIGGNCDERGTEEYNLALGDRRANAVASYLESLGVPSSNLRSVSYGKLRPVCEAHVESCWWHNRRATLSKTDLSAQR